MARSKLRKRIPDSWRSRLEPLWRRWKHRPHILRNAEVDRPIFIVGHPRSGTSWLYKLVVRHPALAGGPESHLFDFYLRPFLVDDPFLPWGGLDYWLDSPRRPVLLRKICDEVFAHRLAVEQKKRVVEKTPEHALYARTIKELYPHAKFIHIVRDGRDVMLSVFAYAQNLQDPPADIEEAAEQWCRTLASMDEAQKRHPTDVLEVRYEDMARDPEVFLARIFEFIGEPCTPELLREMIETHPPSTKSVGKWREALSPSDRERFSERAGPTLASKNYEV